MKLTLCTLLLLILCLNTNAQTKDTILINNIEYEICIDNETHKVRYVEIIKEETFIEKFYIGYDMYFYGNIEAKILWDCSAYGKIGLGYDIGNRALSVTAYLSLGRLHRRRETLHRLYF